LPTALPVRYRRDEHPMEFVAVVAFALSPLLALAVAMLLTIPKSPCAFEEPGATSEQLPHEVTFARTGRIWSCQTSSAPLATRERMALPLDDIVAAGLRD